MTEDKMRRALELMATAKGLRAKLNDYVLLKQEPGEFLRVGDPIKFRDSHYTRVEVPLPDEARRYIFRLWRKDLARQFNTAVRELNQIGASHGFRLIEFSPLTGEPK